MTKRVLMVGHSGSRSGAPRVMLHLLGALSSRWKPEVLLRTGGPLEREYRASGPLWNLEHPLAHGKGLDARLVRGLIDRPFLQPRRLRGWVDEWASVGNMDVVHNNTATNGRLLRSLRRLGCPIVTHLHETNVSILRSTNAREWDTTLECTDRFIAVSDAVKDDLVGLYDVAEERVVVIPNFLPDLPHVEDRRVLPGVPQGVPVVGGCGYIDELKGVDLFAEVAVRVRDRMGDRVAFVWTGPLVDRQLKDRIDRQGVVQWMGEVEAGADLAQSCEVVFVSSREESFSMVALEAAAAGKPVLGFQGARGLGAVLGSVPGCLVPDHDVGRMAERIESLLVDPSERRRIGEALRLRVGKEFLARRRVPEIEDVWEEVTREH